MQAQTRVLDPGFPAPNFFVVGAAKAGTTSLHGYLSQHPEVFMSVVKEPHYFADFQIKPEFDNFIPVIRDSRAYQALFVGSAGFKAIGEASPSYLCDPGAAVRIKLAVPDAKILISLRNPVQRAYSHYLMEYHAGREKLAFADALKADELRSDKRWGSSFQYVELGLYAAQVERYLEVFGSSQVMVVVFEEMVRDTAGEMERIARFLGIDPSRFPASAFDKVHFPFEASRGRLARSLLRFRALRVWSKSWLPKTFRTAIRDSLIYKSASKPKLDDDTRRSLDARFAADLRKLEQVLQRDLSLLKSSE
jgi:hypothetical protein